MECKFVSIFTAFNWFSELIDTLWNVNTLEDVIEQTGTTELIDTLWNVNKKILDMIQCDCMN